MARIVMLVNRTNEPLEFMFDSVVHLVPVGESPHEDAAARHAYDKLIRDLNPFTLQSTHMVGIKGEHDCSLLEGMGAKPDEEELVDRTVYGKKSEKRRVTQTPVVQPIEADSGRVMSTASEDE